jgi:hypothetical protein
MAEQVACSVDVRRNGCKTISSNIKSASILGPHPSTLLNVEPQISCAKSVIIEEICDESTRGQAKEQLQDQRPIIVKPQAEIQSSKDSVDNQITRPNNFGDDSVLDGKVTLKRIMHFIRMRHKGASDCNVLKLKSFSLLDIALA